MAPKAWWSYDILDPAGEVKLCWVNLTSPSQTKWWLRMGDMDSVLGLQLRMLFNLPKTSSLFERCRPYCVYYRVTRRSIPTRATIPSFCWPRDFARTSVSQIAKLQDRARISVHPFQGIKHRHASLFLFFAGLVIFLIPANPYPSPCETEHVRCTFASWLPLPTPRRNCCILKEFQTRQDSPFS